MLPKSLMQHVQVQSPACMYAPVHIHVSHITLPDVHPFGIPVVTCRYVVDPACLYGGEMGSPLRYQVEGQGWALLTALTISQATEDDLRPLFVALRTALEVGSCLENWGTVMLISTLIFAYSYNSVSNMDRTILISRFLGFDIFTDIKSIYIWVCTHMVASLIYITKAFHFLLLQFPVALYHQLYKNN